MTEALIDLTWTEFFVVVLIAIVAYMVGLYHGESDSVLESLGLRAQPDDGPFMRFVFEHRACCTEFSGRYVEYEVDVEDGATELPAAVCAKAGTALWLVSTDLVTPRGGVRGLQA